MFDESGNFLLYPTLLGIKVVNLVTNRVVRLLGKVENTERFVRIALYQGQSLKTKIAKVAGPGQAAPEQDPTLVALAYRKQRLYLFTKREPEDTGDVAVGRDVLNERPREDDLVPEEQVQLQKVMRSAALYRMRLARCCRGMARWHGLAVRVLGCFS